MNTKQERFIQIFSKDYDLKFEVYYKLRNNLDYDVFKNYNNIYTLQCGINSFSSDSVDNFFFKNRILNNEVLINHLSIIKDIKNITKLELFYISRLPLLTDYKSEINFLKYLIKEFKEEFKNKNFIIDNSKYILLPSSEIYNNYFKYDLEFIYKKINDKIPNNILEILESIPVNAINKLKLNNFGQFSDILEMIDDVY
jgi:hypothetical protein